MVAPANFHPRFTFLPKIKEYINKNNIYLDEYKIIINGEDLYKSYTKKIYEGKENNKKTLDEIKDIVFLIWNLMIIIYCFGSGMVYGVFLSRYLIL
jgi:hypothetical protein